MRNIRQAAMQSQHEPPKSKIGSRPRVYLAGPEVFLPQAEDVGRRKIELCAAHGIAGVFPLDQALDLSGLDLVEQARRIARANEDLMRSADALIDITVENYVQFWILFSRHVTAVRSTAIQFD